MTLFSEVGKEFNIYKNKRVFLFGVSGTGKRLKREFDAEYFSESTTSQTPA